MSIFRKMRHIFHDDWCSKCYAQMDVTERRLFALPTMYVGHYISHTDAAYYIKNMVPIQKKGGYPHRDLCLRGESLPMPRMWAQGGAAHGVSAGAGYGEARGCSVV